MNEHIQHKYIIKEEEKKWGSNEREMNIVYVINSTSAAIRVKT
jgi:hypothetical protein